MVRFGIVSND